MTATPRILAFDTSGPWCAAALLIDGRIVAQAHEEMARGQAERLIPMLCTVMAQEGAVWAELDAIGVGVGPGNFTGIRVGVAAARGLALGLGVPAVGVSAFEAARRSLDAETRDVMTVLPAPRDQWLWEATEAGVPREQGLAAREAFVTHGAWANAPAVIDGAAPGATWSYEIGGVTLDAEGQMHGLSDFGRKIAGAIAEIAAMRVTEGGDIPRPAPLYIRPADAAPPSDPPPVILP